MNDILTTRQVQELLKVDRITVYRMLQDGRLRGVKIGQQWRFPVDEVQKLIGLPLAVENTIDTTPDPSFPAHCVQTIQDLFAEVSQISAVVIDMNGSPLTEVSKPTRFCQILMASPAGKTACQASWRSFASASATASGGKFFTCEAGLHYIGAPIYDQDKQIGLFLTGQFYWQAPEPRETAERLRRLATSYDIPLDELQAAAADIPVIDPAQHARVESWPFTAARAVQSILHERLCFIERLQQIASLTQLG